MRVKWKCTILFDGKVWRWKAIAEGYLGLSGMAEDEDTAEAACKAACDRAVAQRKDGMVSRQFEYEVPGEDG